MKEIKVPILPESITEATVAAWHKKPGDYVELDDVIVEIETDKVVLEVPAEESGVLTEISAEEGETVTEQQLLGMIDDAADAVDAKSIEAEEDTKDKVQENSPSNLPEPDEAEEQEENKQEEVIEKPQEQIIKPSKPSSAQVSNNRMEERVPMTRIRKTIANKLHSASQNTAMLTTFNEVDMSEILSMRASYKEAFE